MTGRRRYVLWMVTLGVCLACCTLRIAADDLSPEEQRGREIYFQGTAGGGEIIALLDGGTTRVNASIFPCASCHGADGRGKNEGGVAPPDITWTTLTKPYPVSRPDGRSRPPYTERTLKRAVAMGLDSGGQRLQPLMPRFQLSYQDATDLMSFLKRLGQTSDPGVSDSSIRIGVLLPEAERLPAMHQAIQKSLSAYFDNINNAGGIYGRRIELRFLDLQGSPTESEAAIRAWLERESIFALTGSFVARAEGSIGTLMNDTRTPMIGAFTLDPDTGVPLNPYVFYLDAGLRGEIDELMSLARKRFPGGARVAIATPSYDVTRKLGDYIKTSLRGGTWSTSVISPDAVGCRSAGADSPPQMIVWLSPQFSAATLQECSEIMGNQAVFLLPGSFANSKLLDLPEAMDHKVFVTMPPSPSPPSPSKDVTDGGAAHATARLTEVQRWPSDDTGEGPALASARLLTWALQRTGRNLSRQKLLEALESVYDLDLGLGFPVTYGPNRRVGGSARKPYIVDLRAHRLAPVSADSPLAPN